MDQPDLDSAVLASDLRNLETLNRFFGGRGVVRRRIAPRLRTAGPNPVTLLDIGSGGGDLCRELVMQARKRGSAVRLLSLDYHPQVQDCARAWCRDYPEIQFVRGDARRLPLKDRSVDLAVCTLALHHFSDEDAVRVLDEMRRVARRAVVSDLCRGYVGYAGGWLATRFTRNPMTRFDGPVSVQRAFTEDELRGMAVQAGWQAPTVLREPWFRMTLVSGEGEPW